MNSLKPIYTEKANCQDCYKCVRVCPVKSISVEKGSATVIYENCILCGDCVEICPAGAKKVRDDLDIVKDLVSNKNHKIIASIAPSYISEFSQYKPSQIISALKKIGFHDVVETALGAEIVSYNIAKLIDNSDKGIFISSACPSVVEYIGKYFPQYLNNVTPLYSPLLSQSKWIRETYGEEYKVVFIGPCIAKKKESDDYKNLLECVITFEDLHRWFEEEDIDLGNETTEIVTGTDESFDGTLYPIEGGMIKSVQRFSNKKDTIYMTFSGIKNIENALIEFDKIKVEGNIFVEFLACNGGCVNGPKTINNKSTIQKRLDVLDYAVNKISQGNKVPETNITNTLDIKAVEKKNYTNEQINEVLADIGKVNGKNELKCAGCGYNTCQDFAISILDGKSERTMCVTYMRQLAQKKANALLKTMPSGIVIVDDKLKIVECNGIWAKLMGEETTLMYEVKPGLEGASLSKIFPQYKFFQNVLETGNEIVGKEIEYNGIILLSSIFTIEPNKYIGGVFRDVTEPWVSKEQIINKAKKVIRQNLSTVQKIAYLLGENASESEILLNGIIESFSKDKINEPPE